MKTPTPAKMRISGRNLMTRECCRATTSRDRIGGVLSICGWKPNVGSSASQRSKRLNCNDNAPAAVRWGALLGGRDRGLHVEIIRDSGLILAEVAATEADTGNLSDGVAANAGLETAGSVKAVKQKI